jgi:hypothetical protein
LVNTRRHQPEVFQDVDVILTTCVFLFVFHVFFQELIPSQATSGLSIRARESGVRLQLASPSDAVRFLSVFLLSGSQ